MKKLKDRRKKKKTQTHCYSLDMSLVSDSIKTLK